MRSPIRVYAFVFLSLPSNIRWTFLSLHITINVDISSVVQLLERTHEAAIFRYTPISTEFRHREGSLPPRHFGFRTSGAPSRWGGGSSERLQ